MVYAEKPEDIEIKGLFNLDQINNPLSVNEREFSFILEGRDFVFRAETAKEISAKAATPRCFRICVMDRDSFPN